MIEYVQTHFEWQQVSSIKNGCISFQDLYVCVSILSEDGWTWNQKLSPYILEKIEFSDKDPRRELFDKAKIILDVNEEPSFCRMQKFLQWLICCGNSSVNRVDFSSGYSIIYL